MNNPLISIIMNCYNGKQYLDQAIKSVINQTYKNWELIFWDNLSEDNSIKIFNKYKDSRLKLFSAAKHTLLYEARNLAFKKTKGDFIAFLDTDDFAKSATFADVSAGTSSTVKGIFDKESVEQSVGEAGLIEEVPVFTCRSSDVSDATFNDTFVIDTVTYYIKEIFPDGTGMTRFTLSG